MAKSYEELRALIAKARKEGVTMSELGRRGGLKAGRVKARAKARADQQAKVQNRVNIANSSPNRAPITVNPVQGQFRFMESFKDFMNKHLK